MCGAQLTGPTQSTCGTVQGAHTENHEALPASQPRDFRTVPAMVCSNQAQKLMKYSGKRLKKHGMLSVTDTTKWRTSSSN